jgi:hypothetical protein
VWKVFSLAEAIAEVERRLGDRQLTQGECVVFELDPCPAPLAVVALLQGKKGAMP